MLVLIVLLWPATAWAANRWEYKITPGDTLNYIDTANSKAVIDHAEKEIRLPIMPASSIASFSPDGNFDYALLTEEGVKHFVFDGEKMVENTLTSLSVTNPLAFAMPAPYLSFTIAEENLTNGTIDIKRFNFASGMQEIPSMAVNGLDYVFSVAHYNDSSLAALDDKQLTTYHYTGTEMVPNPVLSVEGLTNPLAVATGDGYEVAILSAGEGVKWYSFTGSELMENPLMAISGTEFTDPKAIAVEGTQIVVFDQSGAKSYVFDPDINQVVYNTALSVVNGLVSPQGIAIRPGTSDILIVDGPAEGEEDFNIRYFMFDGTQMIENPALGQQIRDVISGKRYLKRGWVQSLPKDPLSDYADSLRVRANMSLPDKTSIRWFLSSKEDPVGEPIWKLAWWAENKDGVISIYKNIEGTEVLFGDSLSYGSPSFDKHEDEDDDQLKDLWIKLDSIDRGNLVRWKAELLTEDSKVTPKIIIDNGLAVVWEANAIPTKPDIGDIDDGRDDNDDIEGIPGFDPKPGWIYTTTPKFTWTFNDPDDISDPDSTIQIAFELEVYDRSTGNLIYSSGIIDGDEGLKEEFMLPTSGLPNVQGPLWSADSYEFSMRVRTWDNFGAVSEWSVMDFLEPIEDVNYNFNVLAFERPRIIGMVNPPEIVKNPDITTPPEEGDLTSHLVVLKGDVAEFLPRFKSGAKVKVRVDSVGPISDIAQFHNLLRYKVNEVYKKVDVEQVEVEMIDVGLTDNKHWDIEFYTDAPVSEFPIGTVVEMFLAGQSDGDIGGTTVFQVPNYAEGIAVSCGSIYASWIVVLQGSEK